MLPPLSILTERGREMRKETRYEILDDYAKVYLSDNEHYMLCDLDDLELALSVPWHYTKDGYARGYNHKTKKMERFHRIIIAVKKGYVTDHINRDRLDNRKKNLRAVTIKENSNYKINQQHLIAKGIRCKKSSIGDRFIVYVHTNDFKTKYIGVYDTLEEAIEARNKAYLDIKGVPFPSYM